jgi:hypothetical protein
MAGASDRFFLLDGVEVDHFTLTILFLLATVPVLYWPIIANHAVYNRE